MGFSYQIYFLKLFTVKYNSLYPPYIQYTNDTVRRSSVFCTLLGCYGIVILKSFDCRVVACGISVCTALL
jgi:hypothetical protein